jgi:hypothetical protein
MLIEKVVDTKNTEASGSGSSKLRSFESHDRASGTSYTWTVRARGNDRAEPAAYARNQAFTICGQASFRAADPHPSAVEYLLGALGGDLLAGFAVSAARREILLHETEVSISGCLNNPLVFLGVIGEKGHPGFETITGTLYVCADAEASILRQIWEEVLAQSPLVNTLRRAVNLALELQITV